MAICSLFGFCCSSFVLSVHIVLCVLLVGYFWGIISKSRFKNASTFCFPNFHFGWIGRPIFSYAATECQWQTYHTCQLRNVHCLPAKGRYNFPRLTIGLIVVECSSILTRHFFCKKIAIVRKREYSGVFRIGFELKTPSTLESSRLFIYSYIYTNT